MHVLRRQGRCYVGAAWLLTGGIYSLLCNCPASTGSLAREPSPMPLLVPLPPPAVAQGMVAAWEASCGPLDQYGMRHTRAFANLCNLGVAPAALAANSCGGPAVGAGSKLVGPDAHIAAA